MLAWISFFLMIVIIASLVATVYYSYRSRTQKDPFKRGALTAKINIVMGFMLISMAILQIFLFETNNMRIVLGIVFFLLGLFNFFSGVRSHMHYRARRM